MFIIRNRGSFQGGEAFPRLRRTLMLVLARRKGETLVIDGGIRVTVVEIRGNQIRLGIEAPKGVPVWRKELVVASQAKRSLAVA
jgi:carbon storage regulator